MDLLTELSVEPQAVEFDEPLSTTIDDEPRSIATRRWLAFVEATLTIPVTTNKPVALDLFAGAGGLALGFEAAGFATVGFEQDNDACATYAANLAQPCHHAVIGVGFDYDVRPDVVIAGPPCQPFSVIGYQRGARDTRDGFPTILDAVERYRPRLALIENVRGLLYRNRSYLETVIAKFGRLGYQVEYRLLKAVDFAVPQNRERVVVVAHRGDFRWPTPTMLPPVSAGEAIGDLIVTTPADARYLTPAQDRYVAAYELKSKCARPRDLHLDRPARTLTCRNLGASTSDMLRIKLPDGRRRMLTLREGARLQSFPDRYRFVGKDYSVAKQIGNAVPPLMAHALAVAVMRGLHG